MTMNLTNLHTVLQGKVDALLASADEKSLLLLSKAIEAAAGNVALSDLISQGNASIALIASAGTTQIGLVNGAGAAKVAAISALDALLKTGGTLTGPVVGDVGVITDGATITFDFGLKNNFELTTSGSRTFANPLNLVKGQEGTIEVIGSPTVSWGSYWKFSNGVLPTFTTRSVLTYRVASTSLIQALVVPNFS